MARDYQKEAMQESDSRASSFRWVQARVEAIRKVVTAHDILRRNGISLHHTGDREEQFPCPFHGVDRHPSARVYPETSKGPSHVWCFVCHENWDSIALWKKFSGADNNVRFTRVLAEMEQAYGISPPERPPTPSEMEDYVDPETVQIEMTFDVVERRLKDMKASFDLKSHLSLGSILDRVRYQFENATLSPAKTREVLQQMLDKIAVKVAQAR